MLFLSACTKLLPIIPLKEICIKNKEQKINHKRNNTYTEPIIKTPIQDSFHIIPRHSFISPSNIKSFRTYNNNSVTLTEHTRVHPYYLLESSLVSPLCNNGKDSFTYLSDQTFEYQNKIEFLKKTVSGYHKLIKNFMDACSEVSKFCFIDIEKIFLKNIKQLIRIQKTCKK